MKIGCIMKHLKATPAATRSARLETRRQFAPVCKREAVALAILLLLHSTGLAEVKVQELLAFTTTNSVRIEAVVTGDGRPGQLRAAIRDLGEEQQLLWEGALGTLPARAGVAGFTNLVQNLRPRLWEPAAPALYRLSLSMGSEPLAGTASVRIGFRSMDIRDGQFLLNGRPIFLRGLAINPPDRTLPDSLALSRPFAEDYVRFLKAQNLNIFRLSTDGSQTWFDVCDELGMLLYAGHYGAPPGGPADKRAPSRDYEATLTGYRQLWAEYVSHPSIVLYYLANELPVNGARGQAFSELLTRAHHDLKAWDPTRPYIGNAGYGEGREGDVCDVHRYWGWYYNSFLTYYNLRDRLHPAPLYGDPAKNQPLTFTECVGSFNGSRGEFNLVRSKQLAPSLGWIGHSPDLRADALRYQSFMTGQAAESFRRMRPQNPRLAGIMPFTILFSNWAGIASFEQMKPKPVAERLRLAYQPVLLSWELWTPQVYAGAPIQPIAHVINDDDQGRALTNAALRYTLLSPAGAEILSQEIRLPALPYYGVWSRRLRLELPPGLATGDYRLAGQVRDDGRLVSTNWTEVFIAGANWNSAAAPERPLRLFDPSGKTAAALDQLSTPYQKLEDLSIPLKPEETLLLGENAWTSDRAPWSLVLRDFVRAGGRVALLPQSEAAHPIPWLPALATNLLDSPNDPQYPPRTRPFREQMNVNLERPDHPLFAGLDRRRFSLWSDYSAWDQTRPGFPKLYPVTRGLRWTGPEALANCAVLADYDRGLEGVALAEVFDGKGSVIYCGFDLIRRVRLDPAADRLLGNLVHYLASASRHERYPLIEQPIRWGDYATERGLVCGSLNGLIVNTEWAPGEYQTAGDGLPPNTGSWNMRPGDQFVPAGRNPFGLYSYTTGSSLRDLNRETAIGSGIFYARIPSGRTVMVSRASNPGTRSATLEVAIAGAPPDRLELPPGQTRSLRSLLPAGATEVSVRYTGEKTLVLRETAFE